MKKLARLALLFLLIAQVVYAADGNVLFQEEFNNLNSWKPLFFPKIKKHSTYSIESDETGSYLKAASLNSASGVVYKKEFDVYAFPRVMWQWKVDNVYLNGNANSKSGDDYPVRIYVMFKYDPKKAGFFDKVKYKSAQLLYGKYPPHSSLNYIWANRRHKERIITSPYTDRAKMILLQAGTKNVGKWMTQDINIIDDYKRAFHENPPATASIAIMNDSDNTGESSISYVKYIKVYTLKK